MTPNIYCTLQDTRGTFLVVVIKTDLDLAWQFDLMWAVSKTMWKRLAGVFLTLKHKRVIFQFTANAELISKCCVYVHIHNL